MYCSLRRQSVLSLVPQALRYQVYQFWVSLAIHELVDILAAWLQRCGAERALLRPNELIVSIRRLPEELLILLRLAYHVRRYVANCDYQVFEQLVFVSRREERRADRQLIKNTTNTPHVNCMIILNTEYNLRRPVIPTLHVEESRCAILATRTEVNDFDLIILIISEENILRFHVAMNNAFILHELESLAHLLCNNFELLWIERLLRSLIQLLVFVQVYA